MTTVLELNSLSSTALTSTAPTTTLSTPTCSERRAIKPKPLVETFKVKPCTLALESYTLAQHLCEWSTSDYTN